MELSSIPYTAHSSFESSFLNELVPPRQLLQSTLQYIILPPSWKDCQAGRLGQAVLGITDVGRRRQLVQATACCTAGEPSGVATGGAVGAVLLQVGGRARGAVRVAAKQEPRQHQLTYGAAAVRARARRGVPQPQRSKELPRHQDVPVRTAEPTHGTCETTLPYIRTSSDTRCRPRPPSPDKMTSMRIFPES